MHSINYNPTRDQTNQHWIEFTIRLAFLSLLLYLSFTLIHPFLTIAIWSIVLTVALNPMYEWMVGLLGGRRRIAAVLLTLLNLLVVIGPVTWLALSLIDSVVALSERLDVSSIALPPPPEAVKGWFLIGGPIYQAWETASENLQSALLKIAPHLRPIGSGVLHVAADAGTGTVKFLVAIILAGFLFPSAPALARIAKKTSLRLTLNRGEEFVDLAGATIRAVSRGVIGISALQALLAAVGLTLAGIPGATLITSAVLILGIIQIGPSIVLIPVIIWSWTAMDTAAAFLFTAYMIPVNLLDNILRPVVLGRGLNTPIAIILVGVIGGTVSYGIAGLFLGPIVLAVSWELLMAWIRQTDEPAAP